MLGRQACYGGYGVGASCWQLPCWLPGRPAPFKAACQRSTPRCAAGLSCYLTCCYHCYLIIKGLAVQQQ